MLKVTVGAYPKPTDSYINVQKELSECKSERLESMEKVVKSSVANSVKEEFKSYSSVVSSSQPTVPVICPEALKSIVAEEDRSRNFLVFGLLEKEGEGVENGIIEVLARRKLLVLLGR